MGQLVKSPVDSNADLTGSDCPDGYLDLLSLSETDLRYANFPLRAKLAIMGALGMAEPGSRRPRGSVIVGFFYRDLDGNGQYDPGEELAATLLGLPTISGVSTATIPCTNCYCIGPLETGRTYEVQYAPDGVEPFAAKVTTKAGLNLLHIPIVPTQPLTYVVPHSHYDVEWIYTHEECLRRIELPQVRQRLDLLQAEPAHVFCNDEECVTKPLVERSDPRYLDMLRRGILEGAIEPKGIVTQNELTMPYGESMIRVLTMGELMLSELLGETIRPDVFWSIDQYGFSYQLPQILGKAGRRYLLLGEYIRDEFKSRLPHSNPETRSHAEFWFEGLDGSKILTHRSNYGVWYYGTPRRGPQYMPLLSHNSALNLQGGDNCPPDLTLIETVNALNAEQGRSKYIVTTSPPFFRAVERDPGLPTFRTECLTKYWNGIYESRYQGRVQNRRQENALLATEALATAASIEGMAYPSQQLWDGWLLTLLNQHHDPLMCPMATARLWDAAIPIRNEAAQAQVDAALNSTISWLAADIGTDEKPGIPVIVFNPCPWGRSAVVEACVEKAMSSVSVIDRQGRAMAAQVVGTGSNCTTVVFLAQDLPALGWRTYYISNALGGSAVNSVTAAEDAIENEFIRVELKDGMIERIVDKLSGAAVLKAQPNVGVNEVFIWKDEGCISVIKPADDEGLVKFINNPEAVLIARASEATDRTVSVLESGPARGTVQVAYSLDWGSFVHTISLDAGSHVIHFPTEVDWDSAGKVSDHNGRRVRVAFNSTYQQADVWCDIPFGVIPWEQSELIRPVNSWLDIEGPDSGVTLMHFGNPSIQVVDDVLYMTLFRSVIEPGEGKRSPLCGWDSPQDEATEDGHNTIRYALYVHTGDWRTANVARTAADANAPLFAKVTERFSNVTGPLLPGEASYLAVNPASLVVSAVKPAEYTSKGVIVRICNPTDEHVSGSLAVDFAHSGADEVDFREELLKRFEGSGPYALDLRPFEIKTLHILP